MLIIVPAENNVPCYNVHNCMYIEMSCIFHETSFFSVSEHAAEKYR